MPHKCVGATGVTHRAQAATCSSNADDDAGCGVQPKDQCTTDPMCGAGSVCLCQSPVPAGGGCPGGVPLVTGNVCVPSNCTVDSDCTACGVCQAEYSCGQITGYYCQTPEDTCVPTSVGFDQGCAWSATEGYWGSTGPEECPG